MADVGSIIERSRNEDDSSGIFTGGAHRSRVAWFFDRKSTMLAENDARQLRGHEHTRTVTGQLADTPTRGLPTRGLDISRTGQLVD